MKSEDEPVIPGVELIQLKTHLDERGYFREILKARQLPKFGQWSMSYMHTGTIKAWHIHQVQTDYWFVVSGVVKAVVCNPETKEIREFLLGDNQPGVALVIPPGVAHGLKVLQGPAILMYITSEEYNPADEGRIPFDSLGYDWFKQDIK